MKKPFKVIFTIFIIFSCMVWLYFAFVNIVSKFAKAEYVYCEPSSSDKIVYQDCVYTELGVMSEPHPYHLVTSGNCDFTNIIFMKDSDSIFYFHPKYFYIYSEYDKHENFLAVTLYPRVSSVFVREGFIYPTIETTQVEAVWLSLDAESDDNIKDKETIDKIVECAKSNGEIELDKDIYDYLKENSWDNHCINLKYEGYPLVEEFFITKTDDGRYIIDQYTAEEYDTIYWDEPAHQ